MSVSISNLEFQSKAVSDRLNQTFVGFIDPATILIFVNLLTACWSQQQPDPAQAHEALVRKNETYPRALRRSAARRIFWESAEQGEPLTLEESAAMADAVIEHALSLDAATVHACCCESVSEEDN